PRRSAPRSQHRRPPRSAAHGARGREDPRRSRRRLRLPPATPRAGTAATPSDDDTHGSNDSKVGADSGRDDGAAVVVRPGDELIRARIGPDKETLMANRFSYEGKRVVVSGGGGAGMGAAAVEGLAELGAEIHVLDLREPPIAVASHQAVDLRDA